MFTAGTFGDLKLAGLIPTYMSTGEHITQVTVWQYSGQKKVTKLVDNPVKMGF